MAYQEMSQFGGVDLPRASARRDWTAGRHAWKRYSLTIEKQEAMRRVQGRIVLPGLGPTSPITAIVSIVDASCSDAPATVVARVAFRWPGANVSSAPFCIALPHPPPSAHRWIFDVTATVNEAGRVEQGDYILTHSVACPAVDRKVTIELERVI
jgi:hypothetical protein